MTAPLRDVRVCDLSQNLAGPFCCQILGDLGAEVVKVEPPGGDPSREWGPPFWGSDSTLFLSVSRSKRSVVLDLKEEAAREALYRLAEGCDVFVHSQRPGVPERLGYDYETIRRVRPDVVYLGVSGYGERGPLSRMPGYDPLIQAFSGIMSLTGHPDGPPARVGGSVVDYGTGMWGAVGILAALRERDATGEGAKLEAALMDTALGWVAYHLMGYLATGQVPQRAGTAFGPIAPYQAFPAKDGTLMIAAGNDAIYRRLCDCLGVPELATDPRFITNPLRVANRAELIPLLEARTALYDGAELVDRLNAAGVPASAIQTMAEVVDHPQVEASEMVRPAPHRESDDYREVAMPLRFDGERVPGSRRPPASGEHTVEVLREIGYADDAIEGLIRSGAAAQWSGG